MEERSKGASISAYVKVGASADNICENLERSRPVGTCEVTRSRRYTTEVASSLLRIPLGDIDWPSRASKAAK